MSSAAIPPEIAFLLEPVKKNDLEVTDPDVTANFITLEAEMNKMGEVNYPQCINLAQQILQNESKHLRAVGWLTLAWFRTEGLVGFRRGLILLHEILRKFPKQLWPQKPAQQSKAIQYLSSEKRIQTSLKQIQPTTENMEIVAELVMLLEAISKEGSRLFTGAPPDLKVVIQFLKNLISAGPAESSTGTLSDKSAASGKQETKKSESPAALVTSNGTGLGPEITVAEGEKEAAAADQSPEKKKFKIVQEVEDLLKDITAGTPVGEDLENTQNQDSMVVLMKLGTEMSKYSGNDYAQCLKWGREILQERSKHLRVAVWLLISWFRTEGILGFKNGLLLLLELLRKYGVQLYPADAGQKSKILQLLNSDTRIKLLEKVKPDRNNAADIIEIEEIFKEILAECDRLFQEKPAKLNNISDIIQEVGKNAQLVLTRETALTAASERPSQAGATREGKTPPELAAKRTVAASGIREPSGISAGLGAELTSDKDAQLTIKRALLYFFEEETKDGKKRKIPDEAAIYGLSRLSRWGKLKIPVNQERVTQIEPPNEQKKSFIEKLMSTQDWDTLIPELEVNFLNREEFLYWFDTQRMVVQALEQKGAKFQEPAQEIKLHLARLLEHLPGIQKLLYKDKKTAFADQETLKWLDEDVKSAYGGSRSREKILPPIIGEDYEPINQEYQKACEELPANFEKNAKSMQSAIGGDTRPKGRFLRLLNLANYCYLARQYSIAKVLFNQLIDQIEEYNIIAWERSLCVSVWQSMYINNQRLLKSDLNTQQKEAIEKQQNELFDRIGKYDSVLALNLSHQKQNEGD